MIYIKTVRMAMPDFLISWWRHQMETFPTLLAICAGNSPVTGELPTQRPVTRSFDVFFDLHLNKWLSKQWWGWWFEMPSRPLLRHCNDTCQNVITSYYYRGKKWNTVFNVIWGTNNMGILGYASCIVCGIHVSILQNITQYDNCISHLCNIYTC